MHFIVRKVWQIVTFVLFMIALTSSTYDSQTGNLTLNTRTFIKRTVAVYNFVTHNAREPVSRAITKTTEIVENIEANNE